MKHADAAAVRNALYDQGTNLKAWSEERGYHYTTVLNAVNRHAGGGANIPWGQKTRAILRDLSKTIGSDLLPNRGRTHETDQHDHPKPTDCQASARAD